MGIIPVLSYLELSKIRFAMLRLDPSKSKQSNCTAVDCVGITWKGKFMMRYGAAADKGKQVFFWLFVSIFQ